MTKTFGTTWWGAQWLQALTHIDYDNRLPRGRSYANRGAVTSLKIRGGHIEALVQGSRPRPYKVAIDVPPIPSAQAGSLIDGLSRDPWILSQLLNRELDPAVLSFADSLGIAVFPSQWQDLSMQCSCPDWAVPCKHIAAVIYLLSREIDGNPFLVFALKGVDLVTLLQDRHIHIAREAESALPTVESLYSASGEAIPFQVPAEPSDSEFAFDYTTLPELGKTLVQILPAQPIFFPGVDFRATYGAMLQRISRAARRIIEAPLKEGSDLSWVPGAIHLTLNKQCEVRLQGQDRAEDWEEWVARFGTLRPADLPDLPLSVKALYHGYTAALHLLARGAVVPQIFALPQDRVAIRWLPALMDERVRDLLIHLAISEPPDLLSYAVGKKPFAMSSELQALTLCSLLLDALVSRFTYADAGKLNNVPITNLFFGSLRGRFSGPGEGAIASGIQAWLARLHWTRLKQAPVLWLEEFPEHFALSLAIEDREAPLGMAPIPMADFLKDERWTDARYPVLQTASLLATYLPPIKTYLQNAAATPISVGAETLPDLLQDTLPTLRLLGIRTVLPKGLAELLRPRVSLRMRSQASHHPGVLNIDDLFQFDWVVAIGDHQLTPEEFEALVTNNQGVLRFRGQYVLLDPGEVERLRAELQKPPVLSGQEALRAGLAEEYGGHPVHLDEAARELLRQLREIDTIPPPTALHATLRPYQQRGFSWLYRNYRAGFGSVIADDMGLGKTLQVLALLCQLKEEGELAESKALIVVPTSLLTNWLKEIRRFTPTLTAKVFHGVDRTLSKDRSDILLTTYGVVRSETSRLKKMAWRVVVIDEAQNIKNPAAAQTKAAKSIPARSFIAMSGTPVENRLSEYWSILDFANRGLLGPLARFTKEFAVPIERNRDQRVIQQFQKVTAPFLLRRVKSDKHIISDLPDKIEQDEYATLTDTQAALYESVVRESLQVIRGESDTFHRQGLVLQMILALKQVCNHPAHYLKKQGDQGPSISGKASLLLDLLDPILANHEKCLIFTQFREMGELLRPWIRERTGHLPPFLHGGVSRKQRDAMVDKFQQDPRDHILILSLKAGGTGLNLTAASHVIHYDLWWNPAVEAQATDRAYRIGQQRNVQVHRLITRATFEEHINDLMKTKRDLANLTVGVGEQWIGNLNDAELQEVFRLG
ncbi:DEAD/DEAH box helicase [Acidithiobacillus sp.]|uniref:DEAD/DEAH box helicase n=1 Tax=Acidithiobacillus sp. TaxID=1872118 RepID=UPI0032AE8428